MKGMKSVEYRIWTRSFAKLPRPTDVRFIYLSDIRSKLRSLRSKRHHANFKLSHIKTPSAGRVY
jgi:hypothetical protein